MDWQQPVALAVVVLTAGVMLRRWVGPRPVDFRQRTGCGCAGSGGRAPSVCVTGRRGERPRILVTDR